MNCKPDQLAWIAVPAQFAGSGVESLNGHVVRTVALDRDQAEACWVVSPDQRVRLDKPARDSKGRSFTPGEMLQADSIPDAWLRPFDPKAAPIDEAAPADLELTA